tara:strand:- start:757 stop:993 length:237 start_codon:yes stop_codon:yes gene_type:complete
MKKIEAYKLSTGKIVESYEKALKQENMDKLEKELEPFLREAFAKKPYLTSALYYDTFLFLKDESEDLYELLKKHYEKD